MPSLHVMNRRRNRQAGLHAMTAAGTTGDSERTGFKPRAQPGTPEYKYKVAEPTMAAVDSLPPEWKSCVAEYGYVGVFLAWRSGRWTPDMVREKAEAHGGVFEI